MLKYQVCHKNVIGFQYTSNLESFCDDRWSLSDCYMWFCKTITKGQNIVSADWTFIIHYTVSQYELMDLLNCLELNSSTDTNIFPIHVDHDHWLVERATCFDGQLLITTYKLLKRYRRKSPVICGLSAILDAIICCFQKFTLKLGYSAQPQRGSANLLALSRSCSIRVAFI